MRKIGIISVIMAAYNAERTIREAIASVLSQTYADWELVIVDDNSKDDTSLVVHEFTDSRIRYYVNENNRGAAETRIRAATKAKGEWIAILDSDDVWEKDKLEKQVCELETMDAGLCYTAYTFMQPNGVAIPWVFHVPKTVSFQKLLVQNIIGNSTAVVRRDLFLRYMEKDDSAHEDFTCWLKMLKAGTHAVGIDEPLMRYRLTTSSKSGNKWNAARMNWKTYRAIGLPWLQRVWVMLQYAVNGLNKHRHFVGKK